MHGPGRVPRKVLHRAGRISRTLVGRHQLVAQDVGMEAAAEMRAALHSRGSGRGGTHTGHEGRAALAAAAATSPCPPSPQHRGPPASRPPLTLHVGPLASAATGTRESGGGGAAGGGHLKLVKGFAVLEKGVRENPVYSAREGRQLLQRRALDVHPVQGAGNQTAQHTTQTYEDATVMAQSRAVDKDPLHSLCGEGGEREKGWGWVGGVVVVVVVGRGGAYAEDGKLSRATNLLGKSFSLVSRVAVLLRLCRMYDIAEHCNTAEGERSGAACITEHNRSVVM